MFELTTLEDYSDESLLVELRRVAAELNGQRLTTIKFDQLARARASTLSARFGSWRNALDLAGISETVAPRFNPLNRKVVIEALRTYSKEFPNQPVTVKEIANRLGVGRSYFCQISGNWLDLVSEAGVNPASSSRRYTDEECYENIITLWTHYGRQPTRTDLSHPPSTIGKGAYERRWGGWRAALGAFIKYVNQEPQALQESVTKKSNPELPVTSTAPDITPRSISLALRYKVLCRDKFRCSICGRSPAKDLNVELHIDHIHPWSKGGQNTEGNLRTLCFDCNLGKGDKIEDAS